MKSSITTFILIYFLIPITALGQVSDIRKYSSMIYDKKQERILYYLSDDMTRGRLIGSRGSQIASSFIRSEFESYGLSTFYGKTFTKSFKKDSVIGRNIVGLIPAKYYTDEYIIVSAHYDHLGALDGNTYNGADDNASGVTALLNLAEMYGCMSRAKEGPKKNILFVAFDGKESNMAGSVFFVNNLPIPLNKIICNINIDQIGSIFAPPYKDTNYVLVLGANRNSSNLKTKIDNCNKYYDLNMVIDYSFYDSPAFAEIFYKTSDQNSFVNKKIPALLFTSGITAHTYKASDDADLISFKMLAKRTILIFYLINNLMASD